MKKPKNSIIAIILSIILVIFIWHKFLVSGNSVIFILLFAGFYYFLAEELKNLNKRKCIVSLIIAVIFGFIEIICSSINIDYTLENIIDKWNIINFMGYTILAWSIILKIYSMTENYKQCDEQEIKIGRVRILSNNKVSFLINMLLLLIAWLPYFLRYYPGLLTADSCAQVTQAIGNSRLTSHHPVFHTSIISIFINIGVFIFNNINTGVALYTIFQMILLATMFSGVLQYLSKRKTPLSIKLIILVFYMFYPINGLFSVTMWKDVLFAGIIPIFLTLCSELIFNTDEFFKEKKNIIIYIVISVFVFLMRNNGMYVVILTMPFIAVVLKKYLTKVIPMFLGIIAMYLIINTALFSILNIQKGSIAEMLSIPLQQIARVQKYHNDELDDETKQEIDKFFNVTNIGEKYNPILSDPVKAELNEMYFNEHKSEFIKLWIKLLKTNFKDYVESFISNSYGYYYPEAKHWVANRTMEKNKLGLEQTPIINGKLVSKVDSLIEKRDIPIISMCFSIGMAFWILVISLGYKIYIKEYKYILLYLPIFILWLTIVASPVFCEYRYAYSLFTTLPLYIALNFIKGEKKQNGKNSSINTML